MPTNVNIVISDKSYENLKTIKDKARFRTNADVIQFALDVAAHSKAFEKLKEGRFTEAFPPKKPLEKMIEEIVEKKIKELKEGK